METPIEVFDPEALQKAKEVLPSDALLNVMGDFFKVMGNPGRLLLLLALQEGELCPSDLALLTNSSRSAVSHQLKILKAAKLVKSRKEGKTVFYSLDDDHVHHVLKVAFEHILEE